jgi:cell volume regulation protein A
MNFEFNLFILGLLLLLSVISSKISARLGVPALLIFLVIGMIAGSDGPGGIYFDDAALAQQIGVMALALILFAGGMDTNWQSTKPVLWRGASLATLGVLATALAMAFFMHYALGMPFLDGLLLGSIVSSTDAAAVFSMLGRAIGLKHNLKPLLEFESGSNDPMAIFLTLTAIRLIAEPTTSIVELVVFFVQQMVFGGLMGIVLALGMRWLLNNLRLEYDGLYLVVSMGFIFFTYGVISLMGGNPFLGLYLAGMVLGNSTVIHRGSLLRFHDGLAWLMQIIMFLVLGLLVFPSRLPEVAGQGLLIAAFLIVVARPLSVFLGLINARMSVRDKVFVSWVGLRGAAPIILATFPLLAGVPGADNIFHLVFFVVLTSVLIQGTTIRAAAVLLKRDRPLKNRPRYPFELLSGEGMRNELFEVRIDPDSESVGKQILELGLPPDTLVVLLHRGDNLVVPSGGTVIEEDDVLLVLADTSEQMPICALLGGTAVNPQ